MAKIQEPQVNTPKKRKSTPVTVTLSDTLYTRVYTTCNKVGIGEPEFIRIAIIEKLDRDKNVSVSKSEKE